jgi:hypothetical protein
MVSTDTSGSSSRGGRPSSGRSSRGRHSAPKAKVYRRRRILTAIAALFAAFCIWLAFSLGSALMDPSLGASPMSRFAEWGRSHGVGFAVTWLEQEWYKLNPAKVGGKPPSGSLKPKVKGGGSTTTSTCPNALPEPATVVSPVSPAQAGEGQWQAAGRLSASCPAIYVTYVRPDTVHTSYVVGIAWMDPKLLSANLYSGSQIPGGGPFTRTAPISPTAAQTLVSAFNAGFRMGDSQAGYYTDGKTIVPLVDGAASVVIYKDGAMGIGQWGRDQTMTAGVVSVRQNLHLIVDGGAAVPGLNVNDNRLWGATLGGSAYVWRSGIGQTANGALVYVGGPGLSITDLADLLVRAGALRGMELDINTDWVNYSYYAPSVGQPASAANGSELLSTMIGGPGRYFDPSWARDFFTMSARYPANGSESSTTTTTSKKASRATRAG